VTYSRWDVVAVAYPFLEGYDAKRRPALVVSSKALHERHGLYWLMMITTAKAGTRPDDIAVSDHRKSGLPESCVIRAPRIVSLGEAQILRRLGQIAPKDRTAVSGLLRRFLP